MKLERSPVDDPPKLYPALFPQLAPKRHHLGFTRLRRTTRQIQKPHIRPTRLPHKHDPPLLPPDRINPEMLGHVPSSSLAGATGGGECGDCGEVVVGDFGAGSEFEGVGVGE